ncbi:twin-arginine translocase TatA/TatE family subunit [Thermomicrobium sp. CFH 73360]|uniref:Sec-independent protein translocase subunit TatA/TatB n=1 Tax=Thermomicrobium sp. CFH 73360 TaxID=2951987 RepID=UPI00207790BD|nr:twin-arginine translocase TatA/TatE family subunit [Thermomicrobium sp. CFH 73360]MCM8746124.1 twin-arginine translocase TatA/TatE family subunit [Thermomicrobium sp. CFH 73360]
MFEGLFQPSHLLVILLIVMIIFGPGKLPEVGAAIGRSIHEFRHSVRDATAEGGAESSGTAMRELFSRPTQQQ